MDPNWKKNLEVYDKLINTIPEIERKGKSMPFTSANGHMFTLFNKAGEIGIRLSKESGEKFMKEHNASAFKSHGASMRGYVCVPEHLLEDMVLLTKYLEESYNYVMSLEPK